MQAPPPRRAYLNLSMLFNVYKYYFDVYFHFCLRIFFFTPHIFLNFRVFFSRKAIDANIISYKYHSSDIAGAW